jgi:hypothetical protein
MKGVMKSQHTAHRASFGDDAELALTCPLKIYFVSGARNMPFSKYAQNFITCRLPAVV